MVTVTILKAGHYQGRVVARGEVIRVQPIDALVLERQGLISLSKPEAKTATKRATYHRRDLRAEP